MAVPLATLKMTTRGPRTWTHEYPKVSYSWADHIHTQPVQQFHQAQCNWKQKTASIILAESLMCLHQWLTNSSYGRALKNNYILLHRESPKWYRPKACCSFHCKWGRWMNTLRQDLILKLASEFNNASVPPPTCIACDKKRQELRARCQRYSSKIISVISCLILHSKRRAM